MTWDLPLAVEINGTKYNIRNKCDYRVILDVISALSDEELDVGSRIYCALVIFYEEMPNQKDIQLAYSEMLRIINLGDELTSDKDTPKIMDWEQDFKLVAPPISRVLGYSVRDTNHYTHWYDFVGAYMEIGECTFTTIVSIRNKRNKGKKLERWEKEFYRDNKKIIDLPQKLTKDELDFLNSEW